MLCEIDTCVNIVVPVYIYSAQEICVSSASVFPGTGVNLEGGGDLHRAIYCELERLVWEAFVRTASMSFYISHRILYMHVHISHVHISHVHISLHIWRVVMYISHSTLYMHVPSVDGTM